MFVYLVIVAVLNVCLGYLLGVYLGYGPPHLIDALDALLTEVPDTSNLAESVQNSEMARLVEQVDRAGIDSMLDDAPEAELSIQPFDEPYDDDVAELLNPDTPENWELNEKFVETSILKLNIAMMKSGTRATELDTRLRACRGQNDAETIGLCLTQLLEDCETYLAEQEEAAQGFRSRISELGELSKLGDEIEGANLEQAAQIETTISNLRHMDFASDLEGANRRILEEIAHLRIARHNLRDQQETAFLAVARYENRLDKIGEQLFNDALTKLRNRIGLEVTLCNWWQQNRHQSRQLSAVLLDLNEFGPLNDRIGMAAADRLLAHFGGIVERAASKADLVGRFSGQQFLIIFTDIGPRQAIKNGEMLRQSLQRMTFHLPSGEEFQTSLSAAYTAVLPDDTPETLFARLKDTLREAKKGGQNQAAHHDGRKLEPVESPNLGAEYVEVKL